MDDPPQPPRKSYHLKPKEDFARANPKRGEAKKSAEHDVYAWRQDERTIEKSGGLDDITPETPSNRRAKDYWTALITVNLILGSIGWWGRENLFILASCGAGIVLFTGGLTWIMWGVIRRY